MKKFLLLITLIAVLFINSEVKAVTTSFSISEDSNSSSVSKTYVVKMTVEDGTKTVNKLYLTFDFYNVTYKSFTPADGWVVSSNTQDSSDTSKRNIILYSTKTTSFSEGTYTIGSIETINPLYGCTVSISPYAEKKLCSIATINDTKIYYDLKGNITTEYKYMLECDKLQCRKLTDDNGNVVYYDSTGNKTDETTYLEQCEGKKFCKEENGKYYGKDGNETTYLQYQKDCKKHQCEIITDGTTKVYYDSNGSEVTEEKYYNDPNCQTPCGIINDIYFDKNGKITTKLEYTKQCLVNKCTVLSDGTYYGNDGNVTTKENYLKQCFSCLKDNDKYYGKDGNEITAEEYDLQCNIHKCEIVQNKYFDNNGNMVDEKTYNLVCKEHKCEEIDGKYFDDKGKIVSKDEFTKSCGVENPQTGNVLPIITIILGTCVGGALLYISQKNKKLRN